MLHYTTLLYTTRMIPQNAGDYDYPVTISDFADNLMGSVCGFCLYGMFIACWRFHSTNIFVVNT